MHNINQLCNFRYLLHVVSMSNLSSMNKKKDMQQKFKVHEVLPGMIYKYISLKLLNQIIALFIKYIEWFHFIVMFFSVYWILQTLTERNKKSRILQGGLTHAVVLTEAFNFHACLLRIKILLSMYSKWIQGFVLILIRYFLFKL
jgi:hypothetical protein